MRETMTPAEELLGPGCGVFFVPTPKLHAYFTQLPWRYKVFHEVGCGRGLLTKILRDQGLDVRPYDKYGRDDDFCEINVTDVLTTWADIQAFDCILMARPCHGGFTRLVAQKYLEQGDMFYIGLERNVEDDLDGLVWEIVETEVGQEGEHLYRIWAVERSATTFHLLRQGIEAGWWEYKPASQRYVNSSGLGGFYKRESDEVLKVQRAQHCDMFYGEADKILAPNSKTGWLAPDGTFFGCGYAEHGYTAQRILGVSEARLEGLGFARLAKSHYSFGRYGRNNTHKATPAQGKVLRAKGYTLAHQDDEHADKDYKLVDPDLKMG